ncbi:hypothetical protein [Bradyrhizobium sp. 153]|uniref:hypothetical protein n=1 Tax=Bradyrhizobium sp. 153 TaxID=2782627 RepID=UPI001FF7C95E|nr:hypothetical protein [Bradyrhizobium sp. 153]MCK1668642.1 hypothetical protein [Bradyrhizobium sp. 153]
MPRNTIGYPTPPTTGSGVKSAGASRREAGAIRTRRILENQIVQMRVMHLALGDSYAHRKAAKLLEAAIADSAEVSQL